MIRMDRPQHELSQSSKRTVHARAAFATGLVVLLAGFACTGRDAGDSKASRARKRESMSATSGDEVYDSGSGRHGEPESREEREKHCAPLEFEACQEDPDCSVVMGRRYDDTRHCAGEAEPAGCQPSRSLCGEALTSATDPDGELWYFRNTCHPPGWSSQGLGGAPPDCDPKE